MPHMPTPQFLLNGELATEPVPWPLALNNALAHNRRENGETPQQYTRRILATVTVQQPIATTLVDDIRLRSMDNDAGRTYLFHAMCDDDWPYAETFARSMRTAKNGEGATVMDPVLSSAQVWYRDVYLVSEHWIAKRDETLTLDGNQCRLCCSTAQLCVHHSSYARLWNEDPLDLITLCRQCHEHHHSGGKYRVPSDLHLRFST